MEPLKALRMHLDSQLMCATAVILLAGGQTTLAKLAAGYAFIRVGAELTNCVYKVWSRSHGQS